jgi:hypothetical protein
MIEGFHQTQISQSEEIQVAQPVIAVLSLVYRTRPMYNIVYCLGSNYEAVVEIPGSSIGLTDISYAKLLTSSSFFFFFFFTQPAASRMSFMGITCRSAPSVSKPN